MKKNRPSLCARWSLLLFAVCIASRVSGQFSPVTLPAGLQATVSEMVVYQNNLMLVLQNAEHNSFSLHKYNGAVTAAVPLPKGYNLYQDTQFEQLRDMLYFMPDRTMSTGTAELLRYDGTAVTPIDIPDELIPRETIRLIGHTPFAYHDVLYIEAISLDSTIDDANPITHWIKYDGTSFSRMSLSFLYSCIRPWGPEVVSDKKLFQDKMYMRYYTYIGGRQIVIFDGVDVTLDFDSPHPDFIGEPGGCDMEVFNDLLYVPTFEPRPIDPIFEQGGLLNSYDGTTEEEVFIPSGLRYVKTTLEPYAGKLRGVMNDGSFFPQWYAYDGTNFTATPLPPGTRIYPGGDQRVYRCQLYIVLSTGSVLAPVYALYAYGDPLECAVLPAAVERIDIHAYARERDWCWTGIDVDWTLPTPCTPPCIDPLMRVALLDKPGQEVWSKTFDKPFQVTYPLDDKQSFVATAAIETNKVFQDFVVLDKELVPAGIEEVKLQMMSRDQKVQLTVATEKDLKVPLIMALQDNDGKTLWQQKLTAPLATTVEVATPQRGTTLRLMLDGSVIQVTSLSVFPNPASGNTTIDVGTNGGKLPMRLTITDFFGKAIYQKDVTAPATIQPDLSQAPKGLYIISVVGPDGRAHRRTLVLK